MTDLSKVEKLILEIVSNSKKGIDEETLWFEINLNRILDRDLIQFSIISLKMKKLICDERIHVNNGSMIVYKVRK